jgi:DNA-directed RNA polymerase I subunit RPA1
MSAAPRRPAAPAAGAHAAPPPPQILKLSVKRIVNPHTYDNLKQPVADGLYDAALGPTDTNGRCSTCQLNYHSCPGHFGHIQLPLPVYNPLVFK